MIHGRQPLRKHRVDRQLPRLVAVEPGLPAAVRYTEVISSEIMKVFLQYFLKRYKPLL